MSPVWKQYILIAACAYIRHAYVFFSHPGICKDFIICGPQVYHILSVLLSINNIFCVCKNIIFLIFFIFPYNTIKLIFKGILFYITFLFTLFFMLGVDSIMDNGIFLQFMIVEMILVLICTNIISKDELYKITFSKYLNKE